MRHEVTSISDPGFSVPRFKLQVNAAGDRYEQEADRIADAVMHMPDTTVQRQCAPGKAACQCPKCRKREKESLQRKSETTGARDVPAIVHDVLGSQGDALSPTTR